MRRSTLSFALFLLYLTLAEGGTLAKEAEDDKLFPLSIIHINDFHARYFFIIL